MYCPNCGKDCGNANFCPNCGKKLASHIVTFPIIPDHTTTYVGKNGSIKINLSTVVLSKANLQATTDLVIPHDDITNIMYTNATKYTPGYLAIRTKQYDHPIISSLDAATDAATVVFDLSDSNSFSHAYTLLNAIASKNQAARFKRVITTVPQPTPSRSNQSYACPDCGSTDYYIRYIPARRSLHSRFGHRPGSSIFLQVFYILKAIQHLISWDTIIVCRTCGNRTKL